MRKPHAPRNDRVRFKQAVAGVLIPLLAMWQIAQPLDAATDTWSQTAAGTYVWGVPANWLSGTSFPSGIGEIANLTNNIAGDTILNLNQVITLGTLNLGDSDGSNTFTLAAGTSPGYLIFDVASGLAAINKSGGASDTISTGIQFNDPFSINNSGGGLLTLSGGLRSVSSNLTFGGTGSTTVSTAAISTAGNLVKNDSGTLTLGVGNTYAGTTTVNGGTLLLSSTTSLPVRSAVTVGASGTFEVQNAFTIGSLSGAGLVTNTSGTSRILTVGRDDTSTIFSGRIAPTTTARVAITKIGAGKLSLQPTGTNASTYTGNTIINGGTIALDTSASSLTSGFLGATPLQITGGSFEMVGRGGATVSQTVGALTVGLTGGGITLTPNGGTNTSLTTGAVTATASGGALLVTAPSLTTFTVGTAIASTALNGRLVFTDGTANTFNWAYNNNVATNAVSGFVPTTTLVATGGATGTPYILTAAGGTTTQTGNTTIGTLKLTGSGSQTLDLVATNMQLGGGTTSTPGAILIDGTANWNINGSGFLINNTPGTSPDLIFQHYGTGTVTVNAGIGNATALALVKAGPGTLITAGTNNFAGAVFVDGGTLSFSSVAAAGAGSLGNGSTTAVTIRDGATLQYTGLTGTISGLAATAGAHTYTLQGGNANIEVTQSGQTLTLGGVISGAGGYTKLGAGTLGIGASSTFTGPLFINDGTVKPTGDFQITSSSSPVTVGSSGTLDINGTAASLTMTIGSLAGSGTVLNSGTSSKTLSVGGDNTSTTFSGTFATGTSAGNVLTKTGSGILTLSNAVTSAWTGGNNVNGGVLRLATSNALSTTGTMNISLAAGPAQLELDPGVAQTLAALTIYGSGSTTTSQGNVLIGSGAAFTLGGTLTVNNTNNPLGATIWGAGNLTLSATRTFEIRDSTTVPAGSPELLVSAPITGAGGLTKSGDGMLWLSGANSYAGTTSVNIGTTILDYTTDNTSKIGTGALSTGGGALILNGNAGAATTQIVTGTTASAGSSTVTLNSGGGGAQSVTLGFGAVTRTAGTHTGTLRLLPPTLGGFTTSSANVNGSLGGWLTMTSGGSTTFTANDGSGNIIPLASTSMDNVAAWVVNDNVTDSTGYTATAVGPTFSINSVRFNAPAATSTVTIGNNNVLRIASGGILETANVGAGATTSITGGYLASGAGNELIFTQDNTLAPLTVSSRLIGATVITKSGAAQLTLSGSDNAFTGATIVQAGTLQATGGSAIGDASAVTIIGSTSNPTLDIAAGQTETIGNLAGGLAYGSGISTGTVNIGTGSTLTINETGNTTFSGLFTGAGTLVKSGTGTLTHDNASTGFTGPLSVNQGRLTLTNTFGAITGVNSITLNGAELYDLQAQSGSVDRIANTATVTLNNTAGTSGFYIDAGTSAARAETIGSVTLNAGQNVLTANASGGTAAVGTLTSGSLTRNNNSTALVRGYNLGLSSGRRGRLIFTASPSGAVGGGGAAGTTQISIYPYLVGESTTATPGVTNLGNSFVMDTGAQGLRPLVITTGAGAEYIFDKAGYDALGDTATDNVRFTTSAALANSTSGTQAINALAIDSTAGGVTVNGAGAGETLVLTAGALLSTGSNANILGGYNNGIQTGGSEYVVFTTGTNQLTVTSPLSTAAAALTKAGAGTLVLNGLTNTYSNGTWFNEGVIEADTPNSLGTGGLNFLGGTLRWASSATFDASTRTVTIGSGGATLDTNGNSVTLNNAVGNSGSGGLTKSGSGVLALLAAAGWSGSTTVSGGTLEEGTNGAISSGDLTVNGGGTLDLKNNSQTVANLTLGAGAANAIADTGAGSGTLTVNGTATVNQGSIAPVLAGSMSLVKSTAGQTVTLSNSNSTYTGLTAIQNGTLQISNLANAGAPSSLGAPTGNNSGILMGSGASTDATLKYTGAANASTDRPILLAGTTGGATIDSDANGLLTLNGGAYGVVAGTKALTLTGSNGTGVTPNVYAGTIEDGNAVVGLTKTGAGTWRLTGTSTFSGSTTVTGGLLQILGSVSNSPTGAGGSTSIGSTAGTFGLVEVPTGGSLTTDSFSVGNNATGAGSLVIRGGTAATTDTASTQTGISVGTAGYGALLISGGSFTTNRISLYNSATGTGVFQLSGGYVDNNEYLIMSNLRSEFTITGGTLDRNGASQNLAIGYNLAGTSVMNMVGGTVDNTGRNISFGQSTSTPTGILNLNGGTVTTNTVSVANTPSATINFNGGTLKAAIDSTSFIPSSSYLTTYVNGAFGTFAGGAVVDTNGKNVTLASSLLSPAGSSGVSGLSVGSVGSGYIGAPYVEIVRGGGDTTGTGATGYATIDANPASATYGQVTGVVLTNPGVNYTATPTVNLIGGLGAGGTAATITALGTVANTSGGLTKTGLGTLTLSGTTLGYTGTTTVSTGTLSITGSTGAAPSTTGINVAGGATLNLVNTVGQPMNSLTSLSLGAGGGTATLGLELGTTSDSLGTMNVAVVANAINFNIVPITGFGIGNYTLLSGGAGSAFDTAATYTYGGLPTGYSYSQSLDDTFVKLVVSAAGSANPTLYWRGAINSQWGGYDGSFNSNWTTDLAGSLNAGATPDSTSTVIFSTNNQTLAGTLTTTLDTPYTINDLVFNNQTGTGPITGITLAPGTAGTLTIAPSASTAGINVQTGAPAAVTISAPLALGASLGQTWTVADSGSVLTLSGIVSGGLANSDQTTPAANSSVIVKGSGAVDLTNTGNTFTGDIVVDGGTFRVDNLADWGGPTVASTTSKTVTLTNGGILAVISGTINPGGNTTTTYKLVQIGSGGGMIDVASGATLQLDDAGQLFGSGGLTKSGLGTLSLRNQGTSYGGFTGTITVTAGTIQPVGGTGYNFGTTAGGTIIQSGAALNVNGISVTEAEPVSIAGTGLTASPAGVITNSSATGGGLAGAITLAGHATIGSAAAGGLTLSGGITGPYNLTIQNLAAGATTLSTTSVNNAGTITNAGTGAGGTTISAPLGANVTGIIQNSATSALTLSADNSAFSGPIAIKAGTLTANLVGVPTTLGDGSGTNTITLGDTSGTADSTLRVVNNFTYPQAIHVAAGNTGVASIIAGTTTGSVIFSGPVTLNSHDVTLGKIGTTGASQFTGGITGTGNVTIHNAATTGTITLASNLINPVGSITHTSTATGTTTINANIGSNVTSLTQNSSTSALTLSGTSIAYTGGTTVSAGTLNVTSVAGLPSTTNLTVAGGGTLNLVNTAGQALTSLSALSLGTGSGIATLGLELGSTSAYDSLGTAAVATVANTVRFNISALSGFGNGSYTLLQGATGSGFNTNAAYEFGAMPVGYTYGRTLSDTSVVLNVSSSPSILYWLGGLGDGKWNSANSSTFDSNWASNLAGTTNSKATPGVGTTGIFNTSNQTVSGALATTLETPFSINDLIFNGQLGTGPVNAITIGAGASGTLTLNSVTTGIDVQTGSPSVTISAPIVLGASQSWNVQDASTTLTVGGAITDGGGAFSLTKTGAGRLLLTSASSTYTGGMTLNQGTVAITGTGVDGSNTAVGLGTLRLNGGTFELASTTGGKTVYVPVEIAGNVSFANTSSGASDTLTFSKAITLVGGTREINVLATSSGQTVLSGAIGDGGNGYGVIKKGTGILALTGANTFTGDVRIDEGTVRANGGTNRLGAGNLILNGGTLDINDNTARDFNRPTTVSANSEIVTERSSAGAGITHGLGSLLIGGQTLTVSGGNVTSGTARLDFDATTFSGTPTFTITNPTGGGVTQLTLGALTNAGYDATVKGNGNLAQGGVWDGAGGFILDSTYSGMVTLSLGNTFTGDIVAKSGTLSGGSTSVTNVFGGGTIRLGDSSANANSVLLTTAISNANIGNPVVLGSGTTGTITMRAINSGSVTTYTGGITGTNNLRLETTNVGGLTLSTGDFAIAGAVTNAGTGSGAVTISSNITSNVTNIIQNSGTSALNLAGSTIAFTGSTTVSAGTLNVTGSAGLPSTTSVTVAGGATLNLVNGVGQTLGSLSGLSLGAGSGTATLGIELGTSSDLFATSAAATTANTVQFNVTGISGFGAGNYNLLTASSGLDGATYQVGTAPGGYTYTWNNSGSLIQLQVGAGASGNTYWRGDVDSSWSNYNAGNTNWMTAGGAEFGSTPGSGNVVIFSNSGAPTSISTTLDGNVTIDSLQFTNSPSGVTAVTISSGSPSTSSLTLAPASSANGIDVAANAGTITISAPVVIGGAQEWDVSATGASLLVSGDVSGSANLTKAGAGTLTLSGSTDSYSGNITISAGTLAFSRTGTFTVSNLIDGPGSLTKSGAGILTLNNNANTFAGPVTVSGGTLAFTSIGNYGVAAPATAMGSPTNLTEGTITTTAASTLRFDGASAQSTNRPVTSTSGALTLSANGATAADTITYNGAIIVGPTGDGSQLVLTGTASREGIIAGGIAETGDTADLTVNGGTWTHQTGTSRVGDDVTVTGASTILNLTSGLFQVRDDYTVTAGANLNLNAASVLSFNVATLSADSSLRATNGGIITIGANDAVVVTEFDGLRIGVDADGADGVLNLNANQTVNEFILGNRNLARSGIVNGTGTLTVTGNFDVYEGTIYANLASTGTNAFEKIATETVTLAGDNSGLASTGASTVYEGTLILDYTASNTTKLRAASQLDMRGSTLKIAGNAGAATSQAVASFTIGGTGNGWNILDLTAGTGQTAALSLGAITRAASNGTLRVNLNNAGTSVSTSTANGTFGLLGGAGFATVKDTTGTWFGTNSSGNIVALTSTAKNDVTTWVLGDHITDSGSGFTGTRACANINSLRFDAAGGSALNLAPGSVLSIASGGILVTDQVTSGSPGIFGGTLATGVTELIVTQDSSRTFEISSRINANNALTKTGAGTLLLSGFNTYSGATQIHAGTLQVSGTSIGDTSAVTLATYGDSTLQLLANETIGQLGGGQRNTDTDHGIVDVGTYSLTINEGAATTYSGMFKGSGTVVKTGTNNFTFGGNDASSLFTGTFQVNQGLVIFSGTGNQLAGVTNVVLNGSGSSLRLDNDQTTAVSSRISDSAFVTLNSTAGVTADALGLNMRRTAGTTTGTETLGRLILNSGHNTVAADGTAADRIGQLNFTNATPLVRNNFSTLFVVGRDLGGSGTQRANIRFASAPTGAIGGSGAASTSTISIYPYMVGETTAGAPSGVTNFGNSFVRYVDATVGLKPLDLTTEYVVDQTAYDALGAGVLTNNVRFTATTATLASDTTGINALLLDHATGITVTGPAQSLQITSGAILSASAGANAIGGFTGITSANPYHIYVTNPSGTLTLNSALTSSQVLVKSGAGTLILNTANSINGVYLNQGILQISALDRIGGSTGALVFAGGTLKLGSGYTGDFSTRTISFLTGGGTLDTNGIDLTLANSLGSGEGGFTKTGAGNLTLNGTATYTGPSTLTTGTITIGANNALGVGGDLTLAGGTTLALGTSSLTHGLVTTSGAGPQITGTGTISAANGFYFNHTGNTQIDAILAGAGGLLKLQTNVLTLNGLNNYTGPTEVRAGTLSFNSIGNVGGGSSALGSPSTVDNGVIHMGLTTTATTLTYTGSGHSSDRVIGLQGTTGGVTINGNGTGALVLGSAHGETPGAKTLTLSGTSATSLVNSIGTIDDCAGTLSVTKSGTNTWAITAASTYTGATTVSAGILRITNALSLGTNATGTTVAAGSTLQLDGGIPGITVSGETLSLTASASGQAILNNVSGNNTWTGNLTVNTGTDASNRVRILSDSGSNLLISGNVNISAGTQDFVIGGAGDGEISGTITGTTQRLSKSASGAGTWILSGDNSATFSGPASVGNGTLQVSLENNLGAVPGSAVANQLVLGGGSTVGTLHTTGTMSLSANRGVTLDAGGGAFNTDAGTTLTVNSVITSSGGGLTKDGTGSLVLAASNTYTGTTTVNAGTLSISAENNLGNNPGSVAAGQLTLNGGTLQTTSTFSIDDSNRGVTLGASGGTFETAASTTLTVKNAITGNGTLTKTGDGVLLLDATNDYSGSTYVNQGTLGGTGTIGGAVTAQGGTLTAGTDTATGKLTVGGAVTATAPSTWLVNLVLTSGGQTNGTGTIVDFIAGQTINPSNFTLSINDSVDSGWTYSWGEKYKFASYTGYDDTKTFSGGTWEDGHHYILGTNATFEILYTDGSGFTLMAVPEPETWVPALLVLALGAFLCTNRRRRRMAES